MNTTITETKQVDQQLNHLSRQSYAAYQDFLDRLRRGEKIVGERLVPDRPNYYHYQLPTREVVIYCAERKRNWRGELTEAITIEYLVPQEILESRITGGSAELPASNRQLVSSVIRMLDNTQRLIFVVEFLAAIAIASFMFWSQFSTAGSLGEKIQQPPSESGAVPEEHERSP